jgi:aspartyl-tRNA(Asn)/glutamyl-tRNA(Gln) amidotransferase subunit C
MTFSDADIELLAKLARLHLTPDEITTYRDQLGSILEYVDKLKELDTEGVPELAHPAGLTNVFGEDVATPCSEDVRSRAIESFPRKEGELLEVQAVFADRDE